MNVKRSAVAVLAAAVSLAGFAGAEMPGHAQGEMAGEVTETGVILQSRLTAGDGLVDGDVPGAAGVARFEVSKSPGFEESAPTDWLEAVPENDFIVKAAVRGLDPGTRYYYRLVYGPDRESVRAGEARTFRTLPGRDAVEPVSFAVVTGMNYHKFHKGPDAYRGSDKGLGYPAIEAMRLLKPDFFVGTGDNVYYDHPKEGAARTVAEMRRKWHEQFVQPRYVQFFAEVPTYWEKDDHDYRYNDSDTTGAARPTHEEGIRIFREQVPVVDPADPAAKTYRTHRINKLVQIWLVEGRDYRSPNDTADGPGKSLWGGEQLAWLKRTLLESDAPFKVLISPTPMVGPDDAYKKDNHTNPDGFRQEGDAFFAWLAENGFLDKGFYIVCGDRHWQYHSVHPSGFEEFSTGALVDANARMGRLPGDPESTDPDARIRQPYTYKEPTGGFLLVTVTPAGEAGATAEFALYDEHGTKLYGVTKQSPAP